ncbi:kisspeptin 2 [Betta splendens]|uniref:Kisspeptin 2 n=1 Tax=Betta splendens TaxID=158456 RepID=A0A8M1HHX6_BETSP|nr:kisspeptin 2 [Betta splendens]XP_055367393.1 kisspeptin 2 [Betta splendens]
MRLAAVVVVCALIVGQDGGSVSDSAWRMRAAGGAFRRRSADLLLSDDPNLCLSLRENDDQRRLLCNDRRSKFNFNPFGLRFGKRAYRGAAKRRARTRAFMPLTLFLRELEVPS